MSDARHHLHLIGATGSGKSTLLARMVLDDARHGRGAVVIDPKGDLVTDILMRLPEQVAPRLVLLDATAPGPLPCLNPLDGPKKDAVVYQLVSVFSRVFTTGWGPRTDDILRAACLTLRAAVPQPTLAHLPGLLTDPATRARLTTGIHDPVLRGFWDWYNRLSDGARASAVAPLLNKLRALLLRPFVVQALAAGPSTVDMNTVLDGGLCLVRIPKGALGEDSTRLIGSLVVTRVWQAATARAAIPETQRRDAALYIDEAHNFLPHAIGDMLAEARGYRLALVIAHQHLGQLSKELKEGIATNTRSKIFFCTGPDDARDLAYHTAPRVAAHDLSHLGAYHAAARLVVAGEQAQPFTLCTQPLPAAIPGRAAALRAAAQDQLARHQHQAPTHRTHTPGEDPPAPDPRRAA
ncbi:MAG: type IV secretory system conjugative DNA transfer family protein [Sciscionella sp.]